MMKISIALLSFVSGAAGFGFVPKQAPSLRSSTSLQERRRVVVTGMGITSCLGNTLDEVKESLYNGKCGIEFDQEFADLGIKSQVRGKPKLDEEDFKELIPKQHLRFMGTNAKYAYIAMDRAIQDSGMEPEMYQENSRACAILGQGGTSIPDIVETVEAVQAGGKRWKNKVGPFRVTRSMGSTVSAVLATAFKIQGTSFSISSACSTGAHCIGTGFEQILLGKSDIAFCGAGENVSWEFTSMFDCMGALSTKYNETPDKASRAFDKDRDGFVIAGGGGVMILEELEHAKARGAKIYAELVGYGANSDGYDMVAPSGVGGEACMNLCYQDALQSSSSAKEIDYINTHGTSTPIGDIMELQAIQRFSAANNLDPYVGSTKSLSGHALGAAGVHEAIYSVLMLHNQFLAPSINIENLVDEATISSEDDESKTTKILKGEKSVEDVRIERCMSNSFGFGGTNCSLMFDRYHE